MSDPLDRPASKLVALAYTALGVGFLLQGISMWRTLKQGQLKGVVVRGRLAQGQSGLGESLADAVSRTKGAVRSARKVTVHTIEQRVEFLKQHIKKGAEDPKIIERSRAVLSRKCGADWCIKPKDYESEARALFQAVVDPRSPFAVRYTRDHATVDQFFAPGRTAQLRAADCDDLSTMLGAMILSTGGTPELVVMQAKGAPTWSHVLLRVPLGGSDGVTGGRGGEHLYLDPSMPNKPAGWAPPGLDRVLRGEGPSGITVKAKVFRVV